jgi:hypothetical protein
MTCRYWKCWLWGHREEFGHEWLRDNITYRIFKMTPPVYQLRCLRDVEWVVVDSQEFMSYLEREMNKRYAQQICDHVEFVEEDNGPM